MGWCTNTSRPAAAAHTVAKGQAVPATAAHAGAKDGPAACLRSCQTVPAHCPLPPLQVRPLCGDQAGQPGAQGAAAGCARGAAPAADCHASWLLSMYCTACCRSYSCNACCCWVCWHAVLAWQNAQRQGCETRVWLPPCPLGSWPCRQQGGQLPGASLAAACTAVWGSHPGGGGAPNLPCYIRS